MTGPHDDLTPKQVKALAALLGGQAIEAAAQDVAVGAATLHRWLREPRFRDALHAGRRDLAQAALAHLQTISRSAVDVIDDIMTDERKPASVRLRAALAVLELTAKWLELQDFAARLRALEEERYARKS